MQIRMPAQRQNAKAMDQVSQLCNYIDDEVTARIAKAIVAFGRLRANVWERNGNKLDTSCDTSNPLNTKTFPCNIQRIYSD